MNMSRAIFLISDDVRAVACTYEPEPTAKTTVFKTLDASIKVGDYVTVPTNTRHNMTVVKVVETDLDPDIEIDAHMDWIIGRVNRADFESITAHEQEAIAKIKKAERKRKRDELRRTLIADAEDELKALPIYTATDDNKNPF